MNHLPDVRPIRDHSEYLAALQVRIAVFVTEQGGPASDEPDTWDASAQHFVVVSDGEIVGTARIYRPEPGVTKLGRICLLSEYRRRGWGALLLRMLLQTARRLESPRIVLDAQVDALPFYARFGFSPVGEELLDGGILHRRMVLT